MRTVPSNVECKKLDGKLERQCQRCGTCRLKLLVQAAVRAELRRRDAEELAQWARCFDGAQGGSEAQVSRIIQTASARALMLQMRDGPSDDGSGTSD